MLLKKLLKEDEARSYTSEKKYIIWLFILSFLVSFNISLFITYADVRWQALTHFEFYQTVFNGVLILCMVPYIIAYITGRLLTGVARLLRDERSYNTQYSLIWLLFIFFSYFAVVNGMAKARSLSQLQRQCIHSTAMNDSSNVKQQLIRANCGHRALNAYALLKYCQMGITEAERSKCSNHALSSNGIKSSESTF